MLKQLKKKLFAVISAALILTLLLAGCAQIVLSGFGEQTGTERTALPTVAVTDTATSTPSPSPTTTITPTPTAAPAPTPTSVSVPLPPIPENFIVADELWSEAAFLRWTDEKLYKGVIFFTDIPVGSKLYAPMSGYLHVGVIEARFGSHTEINIGEATDWSESGLMGWHINFAAGELELLDLERKDGQFFVEKGQPFAKVTKKAELLPGTYEQKPELRVTFDNEWADMIDNSIEDPKEYAWSAIQIYESEQGN